MNAEYYHPLLTDKHQQYRNTIREFAETVIKPVARQ